MTSFGWSKSSFAKTTEIPSRPQTAQGHADMRLPPIYSNQQAYTPYASQRRGSLTSPESYALHSSSTVAPPSRSGVPAKACFVCRNRHLGCDKGRPCLTCKLAGIECRGTDPSLPKRAFEADAPQSFMFNGTNLLPVSAEPGMGASVPCGLPAQNDGRFSPGNTELNHCVYILCGLNLQMAVFSKFVEPLLSYKIKELEGRLVQDIVHRSDRNRLSDVLIKCVRQTEKIGPLKVPAQQLAATAAPELLCPVTGSSLFKANFRVKTKKRQMLSKTLKMYLGAGAGAQMFDDGSKGYLVVLIEDEDPSSPPDASAAYGSTPSFGTNPAASRQYQPALAYPNYAPSKPSYAPSSSGYGASSSFGSFQSPSPSSRSWMPSTNASASPPSMTAATRPYPFSSSANWNSFGAAASSSGTFSFERSRSTAPTPRSRSDSLSAFDFKPSTSTLKP